ncbi:MAG: aminotransferase class I/II-fold pyridoxal phosphate-dependent enzyme [Mariniblastus sp.]|nr:aminotransferase class I/II-fold pyridoxal phosphate-dependent enzyme [Mariniblastus sp.]MDG2183365.1 aminotransferase class I/II-fold pyridoxal phosphate-dependent enzyme [Mariniblastus sp.]
MPAFDTWIANRTHGFDSSGIRRMFDLAAKLKDPINLSIGQPDFDVPPAVKSELVRAVEQGKNGYAATQGMPVLREKLQAEVDSQFGHDDRELFVCSGTSGGLFLAVLATINPGDEVIYFDPFFVMYPAMIEMAGGKSVKISTYPDFRIDIEKVKAAITPKTKMIILNSPSNPTGICPTAEEIKAVAELAHERGICLVSDEIYSKFTYDEPHISAATYNPDTIVIDGFSKTYAMTGWRVGYVHGPAQLMQTMLKIQQYTFVCAPQPAQWAGAAAMDVDMSPYVTSYKAKRDRMLEGLKDDYEIAKPGGAFYLFPKLPWGNGQTFIEEAIANNMMVIPGNIFSDEDTHFRISYAVDDAVIERGIETLCKIARNPPQ